MLQVVYRSHGADNRKNRPPYYSKAVALASFLRAWEQAPVEVVFLNDGPVPADRLRMMEQAGEVVELPSVGMRGSHFHALGLGRARGWPDESVAYLCEDDYLFAPQALRRLAAAVTEQPDIDYFALYGGTPGFDINRSGKDHFPLPRGWQAREPRLVEGIPWRSIVASTSSFGARVRALRQDHRIHRQAAFPYRNRVNDYGASLVSQGYEPYGWKDLGRALRLDYPYSDNTGALRGAALVPFRAALNVRSWRRPDRRRLLYAPQPNLATHMENGWVAPGVDWESIAADAEGWIRSCADPTHGELPVAPLQGSGS